MTLPFPQTCEYAKRRATVFPVDTDAPYPFTIAKGQTAYNRFAAG